MNKVRFTTEQIIAIRQEHTVGTDPSRVTAGRGPYSLLHRQTEVALLLTGRFPSTGYALVSRECMSEELACTNVAPEASVV
jgi:hypothetical protein